MEWSLNIRNDVNLHSEHLDTAFLKLIYRQNIQLKISGTSIFGTLDKDSMASLPYEFLLNGILREKLICQTKVRSLVNKRT